MKLPMYICKIMQQCNSGPYFKTIGVHIDSAVGFYSFCCCIFGNRRCKKHAKGNRIIINLLPLCWALMQMMLYGYINMHILVQIWIISKYIIILLRIPHIFASSSQITNENKSGRCILDKCWWSILVNACLTKWCIEFSSSSSFHHIPIILLSAMCTPAVNNICIPLVTNAFFSISFFVVNISI